MIKLKMLLSAITQLFLFVIFLCSLNVWSEELKKIEDNSFLIEEAYNQEEGVVQYIQTFQYSRKTKEWMYTFTHEMPFPNQTHQLSYVIPIARVKADEFQTGLGDIGLNYRYQLVSTDTTAFAPRFSLILPTGDYENGLGDGAVGYQMNLPLSIVLSERWVSHWNAGATYTPKAKEVLGARGDLQAYNFGASIIYIQSETFNWMLEYVRNNAQSLESDGSTVRDDGSFINPGFRFAKNYASGWQMVSGLSVPIGIGPSRKDNSVLLYLSLEK
jgi:hypothetical protein